MAYLRLQLNPPPPHTSQYAFSWTTLPPSERKYFMNDTYGEINKNNDFQKKEGFH